LTYRDYVLWRRGCLLGKHLCDNHRPLIADDPSTPQFVDMINKLVLWLRP